MSDILDELGIITDPRVAYNALKAEQKAKQSKPKTEYEEQKRLLKWASKTAKTTPELQLLFHIPNGAAFIRNPEGFSAEANRMKASGMKSGVPDLFLPVRRGSQGGLWIEMKKAGGRVSKAQSEWIDALRLQGFTVAVCFGWIEARDVINNYLNNY